MASSRVPPSKPLEIDLTIVNAKHLKNVNWEHGDLKPYAIFWVDPDRRLATKPDDSGSTRPVWNEQFRLPLHDPDSVLTLQVFHSRPSETPKPLVGSLLVRLRDLPDTQDRDLIRTFELFRPSGRPHGKIRIKLAISERPVAPEYVIPPSAYYYEIAPPPPPPPAPSSVRSTNLPPPPRSVTMPPPQPATVRECRPYSVPTYAAAPLPPPPPPASAQSPHAYAYAYPDAYSGYHPGHYSSVPPPPTLRPFYDWGRGYGGPSGGPGPSAPVDYTTAYQKQRSGRIGLGAGLAVGAVAGALGGLALEEGLNYEEQNIAERVEGDLAAADDYCEYPANY